MKFQNVSIHSLAHVDAPHRVSSAALSDRLAPTMTRLGMRLDLLEDVSGIIARRYWDEGVQPSQAATMAAEKVFAASGLDRSKVGVLVNTSVCRDYIEPSVACLVHNNLKLSEDCLNFDLGNACLAFMNGMQLVANMIERGQVEYGLVVDGESSKFVQDATIARLSQPETTKQDFRDQFATLTLLCRSDLAPEGHRFTGSVAKAATQHSRLCYGQLDRMYTDAKALMMAGLELASTTWAAAQEQLGWSAEKLDELVMHQVSAPHTNFLCQTLGLDIEKALAIYPEFGNIGPAGLPIVLSKAAEAGRLKKGDRIALMGIGSGLNCSMGEVIW